MGALYHNTWLHFKASGDGAELLDYDLPQPHIFKRYNDNSYRVAWLVDGYFHTKDGITYLNDMVARLAMTMPINQRLYYSPLNPPQDITPYKLEAFQNAKSLRTNYVKQAVKHENELSKDKVWWSIKYHTESLIRQFGGWFSYELLEEWAFNIFDVGEDVKDSSTLRAKCRGTYGWYEDRQFKISSEDRGFKMSRADNMARVNELRSLNAKNQVLMASNSLFVKNKSGKIIVSKVAETADVSVNTAKKYLKEMKLI